MYAYEGTKHCHHLVLAVGSVVQAGFESHSLQVAAEDGVDVLKWQKPFFISAARSPFLILFRGELDPSPSLPHSVLGKWGEPRQLRVPDPVLDPVTSDRDLFCFIFLICKIETIIVPC